MRKDVAEVEAAVRCDNTDVLVLDSLRTLAPGLTENDSAQVSAALVPLQ